MHKIISTTYLFILILSIIGLSTGYIYYETQSSTIKEELTTKINIKEDLSSGVNNIPKRLKTIIKTFLYSILIIPIIISIFNIFYYPFQIGFILNLLDTFSIKLSLIYISLYHIIPLVFTLILIRISIKISKNIIELLIFKDKLGIKEIKRNIKHYLYTSIVLLFYEFLILIFSSNINSYLVTFLT